MLRVLRIQRWKKMGTALIFMELNSCGRSNNDHIVLSVTSCNRGDAIKNGRRRSASVCLTPKAELFSPYHFVLFSNQGKVHHSITVWTTYLVIWKYGCRDYWVTSWVRTGQVIIAGSFLHSVLMWHFWTLKNLRAFEEDAPKCCNGGGGCGACTFEASHLVCILTVC